MSWKIPCRPAAILLASLLATVAAGAGAETPPKPKLPPAAAPLPAPIKMPAMVSYVAKTAQPVAKSGTVPAGAISWQCQGNQCQSSGAATTPTVNACRALASQVGAIQSLTFGNQQLDASGLAQCNAGLAAGAAKTPAPTVLAPIQKAMPEPKPGLVPDRSLKPEVWQQDKAGSDPAPTPKFAPGKPTGGFVPKDQSAQSPNDASKMKPPAAAPKSGFANQDDASGKTTKRTPGPVAFTTAALTVTGTGAFAPRLPFTPKSVTTTELTVTGTGALPERLPFTPRSFSTTPLTVTGTGSL